MLEPAGRRRAWSPSTSGRHGEGRQRLFRAARDVPQCRCGTYVVPLVDFRITCMLANTAMFGAYRGAGRPECLLELERLMDTVSCQIGIRSCRAAPPERHSTDQGLTPMKQRIFGWISVLVGIVIALAAIEVTAIAGSISRTGATSRPRSCSSARRTPTCATHQGHELPLRRHALSAPLPGLRASRQSAVRPAQHQQHRPARTPTFRPSSRPTAMSCWWSADRSPRSSSAELGAGGPRRASSRRS